MNITTKHNRLAKRLVPIWNVMLSPKSYSNASCSLEPPYFMVKRAGRALNDNEYEQLGKSALMRGGEQNVNIQSGFLGGIGGFRVLGESTG